MGIERQQLHSSLRFSLGASTTAAEIEDDGGGHERDHLVVAGPDGEQLDADQPDEPRPDEIAFVGRAYQHLLDTQRGDEADTAGLRRKARVDAKLEKLSTSATLRSSARSAGSFSQRQYGNGAITRR